MKTSCESRRRGEEWRGASDDDDDGAEEGRNENNVTFERRADF